MCPDPGLRETKRIEPLQIFQIPELAIPYRRLRRVRWHEKSTDLHNVTPILFNSQHNLTYTSLHRKLCTRDICKSVYFCHRESIVLIKINESLLTRVSQSVRCDPEHKAIDK
jgi:hypothetical protein